MSLILCRGQLESTVAEEKQLNPRLSKNLEEFVEIMENLKLAHPKKIGKFNSSKCEFEVRLKFFFQTLLSQLTENAASMTSLNIKVRETSIVVVLVRRLVC